MLALQALAQNEEVLRANCRYQSRRHGEAGEKCGQYAGHGRDMRKRHGSVKLVFLILMKYG